MANMIMNTVYNQYLTAYAPKKSDSRFDTHKRSELKHVYNSMVKVNRDAPLYILENNPDMREFLVGLKEESRELKNTIVSIAGDAKNINLNSRVAYSSDEQILSAAYIGDDSRHLPAGKDLTDGTVISKNGEVPNYEIEVKSLAAPQINLGKFLPEDDRSIAYGDYSFDVNVGDQGYEFQFSVQPDDTNFDIQNRISRLINNSGIGLSANIENDAEGKHALRIVSNKIGLGADPSRALFSIRDNRTVKLGGSVSYLGLDYVAQEARNAVLTVNGKEIVTNSNSFTMDDTYEITLHNISPNEGQTVTIGIKPDTEALQENIHHLLGGYNNFMKGIGEFEKQQQNSLQLVREFKNMSNLYQDSFEKIGITKTEEGQLNLDDKKLNTSVALNESMKGLSDLEQFSSALIRKTDHVSLDPIHYVNKKIVAYKNPANSLMSPYVSSAYAGIMFNGYC